MPNKRNRQIIYQVQAILDEAVMNYQPHYLIKWKNLGHQYDTWEPLSDLHNIIDYLKFWIKQRKLKAIKNKTKKEQNFNPIKALIPSESLLSKRTKENYADHYEEKKRKKYDKLSREILGRKKTWEKYIENNEKMIMIDDDDKEAEFIKENEQLLNQILNNRPQKKDKEEIFEEDEGEDKHFRVIGAINMSNIRKINRQFTWKDTDCLQIQMTNGKTYNIKEQEIKNINPQMLIQFKEENNIPF